MKRTNRVLAILLALVMALGLLPLSAFAATTVTQIEIEGFQSPVIGQTAKDNLATVSVPAGADYELTNVFWFNKNAHRAVHDDETFAADVVYYVQFEVYPKFDNELDPNGTITIGGETELVDSAFTTWHGTASVTFFSLEMTAAAEPITRVDIYGFSLPEVGETAGENTGGLTLPDNAPFTVFEKYWLPEEGGAALDDDYVFLKDQNYYLTLTLEPNDGYCFDENNLPAIALAGDEYVVNASTVSVVEGLLTFDTNAMLALEYVSGAFVTGFSLPIIGQSAGANTATLTVPDGAPYLVTGTWYNGSPDDPGKAMDDSDLFEENKEYFLHLGLTIDEGCWWNAVSMDTPVLTNDEGALVPIFDWQMTGAVLNINSDLFLPLPGDVVYVNKIDVTGAKKPAAGETVGENLATVAPGGDYFTITDKTWHLSDDVETVLGDTYEFEDGKTYFLRIVVKLKDGYSFDPFLFMPPAFSDSDLTFDGERIEYFNPSLFFGSADVTPGDTVWGDANGDGVVNNKDIVRLKNYLANYDDETETSTVEIFPGADANGDGVISNKDIVRLKNYFANYDDDTETSTVTLGPA